MIQFVCSSGIVHDDKKNISDWLNSLAHNEGFSIKNLCYNFVSVEKILSINKQFLNHDFSTDVIAFDYSEGKHLSGDVFICQEVVEKNAYDYAQTVENETLRVLCHALFHLCGYKDKSDKDLAEMRLVEDKAIAAFKTTHK